MSAGFPNPVLTFFGQERGRTIGLLGTVYGMARFDSDSIGNFTLRLKNIVRGSRYRVEVASTGALVTGGDGSVSIPAVADKLQDKTTGVTNITNVSKQISGLTDNTVYTLSVYVAAAGWGYACCSINDKAGVNVGLAYINLTTGAVNEIYGDASAELVGDGWWRLKLSVNVGSGASTPVFAFYIADADTHPAGISHSTSAGNGIGLWGARLDEGAAALSYYTSGNLCPDPEDFSAWTLNDAVDGEVVANALSPAAYVGTTDVDLTLPYYAAGNANNDLKVKVRKGSASTKYLPFETQAVAQAGTVISYISQAADPIA
jgi:hypothetical protein